MSDDQAAVMALVYALEDAWAAHDADAFGALFTPDATYTRGFAKLDPGDLLCLYTDGIVEAHDKNDREFSLDRLQRLVKANRQRSAQEIGQEVLAKVAKWGREGEDDRTVVIVKAVAV